MKHFLRHSISSKQRNAHYPPNENEVQSLISYLKEKGLDPVLVGSMALIKHLKPSTEEMVNENLMTQDIDVFIKSSLPNPPVGWRRDRESLGVISWISPSGGYVDFLEANHNYPDGIRNPPEIGKDNESEKTGYPVADLVSVYIMKLNSHREKDLYDLVRLAKRVGIPKELSRYKLNKVQKDTLSLIELWIANG